MRLGAACFSLDYSWETGSSLFPVTVVSEQKFIIPISAYNVGFCYVFHISERFKNPLNKVYMPKLHIQTVLEQVSATTIIMLAIKLVVNINEWVLVCSLMPPIVNHNSCPSGKPSKSPKHRRKCSLSGTRIYHVRFEVFTAVTMKNGVFSDVMLCGSCKDRRFGGT
jgi:hypothetical protein